MAAETGSTNISGTMIDSVEIPTAILGFSTKFAVGNEHIVVLLLKLIGAFYPQAQHVCVEK